MKKEYYRERECIHRDQNVEGEFFNGSFYVQALRQLHIDAAMQMAQKVSPFFWADAPHILVWLCHDCASEVGLKDTPRSIVQGARRQA